MHAFVHAYIPSWDGTASLCEATASLDKVAVHNQPTGDTSMPL